MALQVESNIMVFAPPPPLVSFLVAVIKHRGICGGRAYFNSQLKIHSIMTRKSRQQQEVKAAGNTHPKQEIGESGAATQLPSHFKSQDPGLGMAPAHPEQEKRLI